MFHSLLCAVVAMLFLANCSGKKGDDHAHGHEGHDHHDSDAGQVQEASATQFQVDEKFQNQLGDVFTAYADLQEAFVSSDPAAVKEDATRVIDALAKVDMKLLTDAAHNDWMNYQKSMDDALNNIKGSEDIEEQRKSFSVLSDNLCKSAKAFGLGGEVAYYAYCPMAFNDAGGYWLSKNEKIRNPYFGDKMLTCGMVKEKLN